VPPLDSMDSMPTFTSSLASADIRKHENNEGPSNQLSYSIYVFGVGRGVDVQSSEFFDPLIRI
jgi:hypothetical protein